MNQKNTARPLILKRIDWPKADRLAWDKLFMEGDILDGVGPCFHWSAGSRSKREQSYGHWLGFCQSVGALHALPEVTDRATEDRIQGFLKFELARCCPRTVYMHAEDLWTVFRAMSPHKGWRWLGKIVGRLRSNCASGQLKPRLGISADEIYAWALARMGDVDSLHEVTDVRRAALFRDTLMVGVLVATGLRLRTFIAIDLERHLGLQVNGFTLSFMPEDMKNKKAHKFFLPADLTEPMHRYLQNYRPKLLGVRSGTRLWITQRGKPFSYFGFQRQLPELMLEVFGIELRPHAFRSIIATSIATDDPDHVNIIAEVLQHSTLGMSEIHYNRANGVRAMSSLQQMVQELRRGARRRDREARRIGTDRKWVPPPRGHT